MNESLKIVIDSQTRNLSIDIIKGIGIFCMVAGHSGSPFTKFVYLFHMAIFFIASGYCYKSENSDSSILMFGFIKKKIMKLWFPYVLWNAIYSCLHNFFLKINVYTDNPLLLEYVSGTYIRTTEYWTIIDVLKSIFKGILLHGGTQMGAAFWFIAVLIELSITYCMVDFIIKRILKKSDTSKIQFIVSIFFLSLGYGCYIMNLSFWGINRVLSYYVLFHGGYMLRKYSFLMNKIEKKSEHGLLLVVMFIIL
jgi:fucose 4-O-acetylase-like acetyltransferase